MSSSNFHTSFVEIIKIVYQYLKNFKNIKKSKWIESKKLNILLNNNLINNIMNIIQINSIYIKNNNKNGLEKYFVHVMCYR